MAIYNAVPPPPEYTNINDVSATPPPAQQQQQQQQQQSAAAAPPPTTSTPVANGAIDIDAWTIAALESLSVSPLARGTATSGTASLAIPIDATAAGEDGNGNRKSRAVAFAPDAEADVPRRPPSRRDSMKKREALLKGKEGSRQRRRWENAPLPSDWEVRPTHPTHRVPYQLAQFWDAGARQRAEDRGARLAAARKEQQRSRGTATGLRRGEVPRDLRESAKRTPAVASWVRSLEEPVRAFLRDRAAAAARVNGGDDREAGRSDSSSDDDSEKEEEIVFRGRRAAGAAGKWKTARREVERETVGEGVVFDSFGDGEAAAYKRWLTHSISDYYGLESRSVTLPDPSRKVVYVGFRKRDTGGSRQVPRPLWEICC